MEALFMFDILPYACPVAAVAFAIYLFHYYCLGGKEEEEEKNRKENEEEELRKLLLEKLRDEHGKR